MNAILNNQPEAEVVNHLPLDMIQPDPNQPRKIFDVGLLDELAANIEANGVMQPIIVRLNKDNQIIIKDGERRYRASQIAGLETIPTLTDTSEQKPIDRLIDQVAANQHDQLKSMDLAQFYEDLVTLHLVKQKTIPQLLEGRGIKTSYEQVKAFRRLLKLPQWAQDMINNGTITPSHGKYILMANGFDQVMDEIKTDIEMEIVNYNHPPTTAELEDAISQAFNNHYRDIRYPSDHPPTLFDLATCDGCKTCKKLTTRNNGEEVFCLDETCFDQKQTEAKQQREAGWNIADPNKPAPPPSPDIDNPESYEGHDAAEAEEQIKSPPASEQTKALAAGRVEKTQAYLDHWLRGQLTQHLAKDQETMFAILLWVGAGHPGNWGPIYTPDLDYSLSNDNGIDITLKHKIDHGDLLLQIIGKAIQSMTRANLRRLAHHCGIKLEGNYAISREYLEIKSKQELIDSTPESIRDWREDWSKDCKKPGGELVDIIYELDHLYGIPADLAQYYAESAQ